jgi:hypothetical protein
MSANGLLLLVVLPPLALAALGWAYALLNPWLIRHGW